MIQFIGMIDTDEEKQRMEGYYLDNVKIMYGVALGYLKNIADAEDEVMRVVEKTINRFQQFEAYSGGDYDKIRGLFVKMIKFTCLDMCRARKRERVVSFAADEGYDDLDERYVSDLGFETEFVDYSVLREAMNKLSHRDQVILDSCYVFRFTYREVGELVDMTENGVKSRISRLKKRLRTSMEPQLAEVRG